MEKEVPKIKVCFVMPKVYALFNPSVDKVFGGAEVDMYYLCTELAKDNIYEVSFVVADYGQDDIEVLQGVRLIKSLRFEENPLTGAVKIWRAMKAAGADIYVLKTISLGVILAWLFCGVKKRMLAYRFASSRECDGTYTKEHPILGRLFTWVLKRVSLVFTQNRHDADMLAKMTGVVAKVIPNGHRISNISGVVKDTVLWVGRSANVKRGGVFVDIARSCPGQKFVMICQRATGDGDYEKLREDAEEVGNLEFIERVKFKEIDEYFARAKAFVNTSDSEGFPNTFIQACKGATPILSLNVNPDDFLNKYKCGLCYNGDVDRMTAAISNVDNLLAMPENKDMGANARKYVEDNHDISRIVEQYKELFRAAKK